MSLSNLEVECKSPVIEPRRVIANLGVAWARLRSDCTAALHEVSPNAYGAALRVSSALAVSFVLVRIAKYMVT